MNHSTVWLARKTVLVALAVLSIPAVRSASSCGLDWTLPTNHFDGVDPRGYAAYWEKIGEADCGGGLMLPLHINFNSKRDAGMPSPYLGQGWLLPLLESRFIQESEDRFVMIQPDGLSNLFLRQNSNGTILNGSDGWKGEIRGNSIAAWANCGWKLMFVDGHIASMTTPTNRRIDWIYENKRVVELREGNITRLKVECIPGRTTVLTLSGGKSISVVQGNKPRVQSVAGRNVIMGVESCVNMMTLADGRKLSFLFDVDENVFPEVKISEQIARGNQFIETPNQTKLMVWDPQTKFSIRDGMWRYQITPTLNPGFNAAIQRDDGHGASEYWFYNQADGKEITRDKDGIEKISTWFMSGAAVGKTRKKIEVDKNKATTTYDAAYNETGGLIRLRKLGQTTYYNSHQFPEKIVNQNGSLNLTYQDSK